MFYNRNWIVNVIDINEFIDLIWFIELIYFFLWNKKKLGMKEYIVFDNILIKYIEKLDSL